MTRGTRRPTHIPRTLLTSAREPEVGGSCPKVVEKRTHTKIESAGRREARARSEEPPSLFVTSGSGRAARVCPTVTGYGEEPTDQIVRRRAAAAADATGSCRAAAFSHANHASPCTKYQPRSGDIILIVHRYLYTRRYLHPVDMDTRSCPPTTVAALFSIHASPTSSSQLSTSAA